MHPDDPHPVRSVPPLANRESTENFSGQPETSPNLIQRILCLFSSPFRAFHAKRTLSFWLGPLLIIAAVGVLVGYFLFPLQTEVQERFFIESGMFQDEQREAMLQQLADAEFGGTAIVTTFVSVVAICFLMALFALLGVNFIVGGRARYLDLVGVIALSSIAPAVRDLITLPVKLSQQTLGIQTSPAALVSVDQKVLHSILALFDVFDIYNFVLLAIGFAVVGSIPIRRAALVSGLAWGLYAGGRLLWGLSPLGGLTG